ncbi:beta-lactamase/transpeptidase-like protein [Lentinula aff. lateritia]|uniref:Beta-lactamase/transpeptidase-like protein n=1 Tax=Lentinula aff. lateritia TaxID=2804960 RepID=A0ACC1U071_9AGAR|nr:beta-lactamase/transpeptidase-like protein [Lentinula aff. lateritia]
MLPLRQSVSIVLLALLLGAYFKGNFIDDSPPPKPNSNEHKTERFRCRPFLPKLFSPNTPIDQHREIQLASHRLRSILVDKLSSGDIDSLSVAVVTPGGTVFEENYGTRRGNESKTSLPTDSHSAYRIALVTKLFTVLEGHILAQQHIISWDDPVDKYLPRFMYRNDTISKQHHENSPVTLLHLASHVSGLGRDWPPGDVANWPKDLVGAGPPPTNGLPFPSHKSLYQSLEENFLVSPQFSWPVYSNTGIGLLGMALVAANRQVNGPKEPRLFAELVQRDIFDRIHMNDSHFLVSVQNKNMVVVPSLAPEVADQDFLDAMNPAAGQFSSLRDSAIFLRSLLNSGTQGSLLSKTTFNHWIHSAHAFEEDDWTEIGFVWEIIKALDSNNRLRRIYWKLGAMAGYHAAIAIHPGTMYGVSVLLSGHYPDAGKIAYDVFEVFQPHIDTVLAELATSLYVGTWVNTNSNTTVVIAIDKGTLYVDKLILNGTNIFTFFDPFSDRLALRSIEQLDEFRIDVGIPFYNGKHHMGCYPYWAGLDTWGQHNKASLNVIYFSGNAQSRRLHVPSTGSTLERDI